MRNIFLVVSVVVFVVLAVCFHPIFLLGAVAYIIIDYADREIEKELRADRERKTHQKRMAQHMTASCQFNIRGQLHDEDRPKGVVVELHELLKNPIYRVMNNHRHKMTAKTICQKAVAEYHLDFVEAMDLFISLTNTGVVKSRLSGRNKRLCWLED